MKPKTDLKKNTDLELDKHLLSNIKKMKQESNPEKSTLQGKTNNLP